MKRVLLTGGAGFVGSHLSEHILKSTDWQIVCLDRFDASGNPNRLSEMLETTEGIDRSRIRFVFWDLKAELNDQVRSQLGGPFDYILHLAAGSHVDRSIEDPLSFFMDNTIGTVNLLAYAHEGGLVREENYGDDPTAEMPIAGKFLYFSTDEVYGPAPEETTIYTSKLKGEHEIEITSEHKVPFLGFKEWDRPNPNNPYAAAKAAAEMAVISFANTYRIPCVITNCMNIMGERQNPEKYIPLVINRVLSGEKVSIHADETLTRAGKRHYLHARNISSAVVWILENGELLNREATKGRYNIVGDREVDNLELAQIIEKIVKKYRPEAAGLNYELVSFHHSRPGHDLRYALDGQKLRDAGFSYPVDFEESLEKMIEWTLNHPKWL
jgi:dTDP-glucose 4,6-dehydratase